MAVEWGRYGIRMNCLAPGPIHTEGAFSRLDPTGQFMDHAKRNLPTGRFGEVQELANLATVMCSPYMCWMTGEVKFVLILCRCNISFY